MISLYVDAISGFALDGQTHTRHFLSGFASNAFLFLQNLGKMRVKQLMEAKKCIQTVKIICLVEFKLLIKKVSKELFLRTSDFILQETTKKYKNENTK